MHTFATRSRFVVLVATVALCLFPQSAFAHLSDKDAHDRVIRVSCERKNEDHVLVRVAYQLDVSETTMGLEALRLFRGKLNIADYRGKRKEFHRDYMKLYAPLLANGLEARLGKKELTFRCKSQKATTTDDKGRKLGHVRCLFAFEAEGRVPTKKPFRLSFSEIHFDPGAGSVDVGLGEVKGLSVKSKSEAPAALKKKGIIELSADDEQRLRSVSAELAVLTSAKTITLRDVAPSKDEDEQPESPRKDHADDHHESGLLDLVFDAKYSFPILLILATIFGAGHALTPGHGKTLVAAYLVGERGTIFHAIILGLVTTLTHTGVVIVLAGVLWFVPLSEATRQSIMTTIGLVMGLAIACAGFYLLLRRLAGQSDHFHIGGHGHHHHHGDHHHEHAVTTEPSATETTKDAAKKPGVSWVALILMGITGGIVPCWDAIVLLAYSIGKGWFHLALPLILAFSAGLAGVLVAVGVMVVTVKGFAESRFGSGTFTKALPIISSVVVIVLGLWLCYDAVHVSK